MTEFSLTKKQILAFSAPSVAVAWLIPPLYAIMADFYLRYSAATAAGIGTAMLASKIVDAITDPPVGYWSDHTQSLWGGRKPWLAAGVVLSLLMFAVFFNPPVDAGSAYFFFGLVLYYIVYTLIQIPTRSWLGEITSGYEDRSRVWSVYTIGLLLGGVLIMVTPIFLSEVVPLFDSAEFDRDMVSFIGWLGAILLVITMGIALRFAPTGHRNEGQPPKLTAFFSILRDVPPLRVFLLGFGLSALGFGIWYSIIVVALTSYFGFAERLPLFMLCMIGIQVVSIPVWERLARRFPKHRVWATAWMIYSVVGLMFLVFDENTEYFWGMVAVGGVMTMLQAPHMLFPVSIMSDIVDYDTWKNRASRSGNFFALFTFLDKVLHAIGFGMGYYIIALFGYDAKLEHNTDLAAWGIYTAVVFVPGLLFLLSALTLMQFPIDSRKHAIIRRAIERRTKRSTVQPPAPSLADSGGN
jgi:Na+/melibiose symporter-like transporter